MALEVWSEFKEQVRAQTNIVALVGETRAVTPRNGGREYVALCPFHDDHSPSLTINPERQTYRCWVCDEGGDCFSYLMKLEGLDFRQAMEQLAQRANLELPQVGPPNGKRGAGRNEQLAALEWACEQFHHCLLNHPEAEKAREYLFDRGFCEEIWADFRMGFHPGPWEWLMTKARGRFKLDVLEAARLISPRSSGSGYIEHFRNRITFPIVNERGQVIAFGGRVLPGSDDEKFGKYQNSRESPLFSKSRQLYGIDHAKEAMREQGRVIVVEGYTDCIALHQQGIANSVATLGTALTEQHVDLIRRFCQEVLLVFDGDEAGQNAAQRALPVLLGHDIELKLFAIPEGMDPPEFLEKYGLQKFQELLQNACDAWEFKLQRLEQEFDRDSSFGRDRIVEEMLGLLSIAPAISGTTRENYLLNHLANRIGLRGTQEQILHDRLRKLRRNGAPVAKQSPGTPATPPEGVVSAPPEENRDLNFGEEVRRLLRDQLDRLTALERDLLEIIITMPESLTLIRQRGLLETIQTRSLRLLMTECDRLSQRQEFVSYEALLTAIDDLELKKLILGLADRSDQRRIAEKLQETTALPEGTQCPIYLRQVIERLEWEHKESRHRKSARLVVAPAQEPTSAEDRMQQLLQDAALFHQQRVTRKTAST
ncbi:DNA primase [bacterium]|nr:DNA primase [bacterium]